MIKGAFALVLTALAALLTAIVALLAFYMLVPIDYNGIGKIGFVGLLFPLHILVVTILAIALAIFAWRAGAYWAMRLALLSALVTTGLALWPMFAMKGRAAEYGTEVSYREYLAHALSPNPGSRDDRRSVVYGTAADGTKLVLDVWKTDRVPAGTLRPAIVKIHGGGWTHGRRSDLSGWNTWLNALGYDVFDVDYRMPPPERWRDEIGDVKCALGWVAAHAREFSLDMSRISVMGYSAGANLAMLAAYAHGSGDHPPSCTAEPVAIRSVINIYGPTDLVLFHGASGSLAYVQHSIREYIGGSPKDFPDRYRMLSPINYIGPTSPTTITFQGESDRVVPVEQQRRLDDALKKAGVAHELYLLPANDHGFDVNWGAFSTQLARVKIKAFLEKQK